MPYLSDLINDNQAIENNSNEFEKPNKYACKFCFF